MQRERTCPWWWWWKKNRSDKCLVFVLVSGHGTVWSFEKWENDLKLEINEFVTFSNCRQFLMVCSTVSSIECRCMQVVLELQAVERRMKLFMHPLNSRSLWIVWNFGSPYVKHHDNNSTATVQCVRKNGRKKDTRNNLQLLAILAGTQTIIFRMRTAAK